MQSDQLKPASPSFLRILFRDTSSFLSGFWGTIVLGSYLYAEVEALVRPHAMKLSPYRFVLLSVAMFLILRTCLRVDKILRTLKSGIRCDGVINDIQMIAPSKMNRFGGYEITYTYSQAGRDIRATHAVFAVSCRPGDSVDVYLDPKQSAFAIVLNVFVSPQQRSCEPWELKDRVLSQRYFSRSPDSKRCKNTIIDREKNICFDVEMKEDGFVTQLISAGFFLVSGVGLCITANLLKWKPETLDIATVTGLGIAIIGIPLSLFVFQSVPRHIFTISGEAFLQIVRTQRNEYDIVDPHDVKLGAIRLLKPAELEISVPSGTIASVRPANVILNSQEPVGIMTIPATGRTIASMTNGWFAELRIEDDLADLDPRVVLATWQIFRWN